MFERLKRRFKAAKPEFQERVPSPAEPRADDGGGGGPASAGPPEPEESARARPGGRGRRCSARERAAILEEYAATDQDIRSFAAAHSIGYSTLQSWLRVERKKRKEASRFSRRFTPEERRAAVEAFLKSTRTRQSFAAMWGCSASSLDKWLRRYEQEGPKGLETKSAGWPSHRVHPKRLPDEVRELILSSNRAHPEFGATRLTNHIARYHQVKVSAGTVRNVLRRAGIAGQPSGGKKKTRRKVKPPRRFERAKPRELWQSDITSYVLRRQGRRVYLTVFLDDHSRYIVAWNLATHQKTVLVTEALLEGIARFGKPKEALTDQGRQYFAWRGKSAFQKLLDREGIAHVVSRTHHPETLGKCERLWKTIGEEFWDRAKPEDLVDARRRLAHWITHYNHFRPHQGIDGSVPADRFFSVDSEVRRSLERGFRENELRLALGEAPRQSAYLVGQIGDQAISLHGERGRLLIETGDGGKKELSLDELGGPHMNEEQKDERRREAANSGMEAGDGSESGNGQTEAGAPWSQEEQLPEGAETGLAGEGAVGCGAAGGAREGSPSVHGDAGVLARQEDEGAGGRGARRDGAARVAAQPEGAVGDAGGALGAAEAACGSQDLPEAGLGVAGGAEAEDRGAGEGAVADGRPGACAEVGPVGERGLGVEGERDSEPWSQQAEDEEGSFEERSSSGSGHSSTAAPERRRSWMRWLRR